MNTHYAATFILPLRRFFFILPLFSFPIICTMESGFVLYLCTTTGTTLATNILFKSAIFQKTFKLNFDFLPNTKLERLVFNIFIIYRILYVQIINLILNRKY